MPNCTKCKQSKSDDEMSLDHSRRSGISSWCKLCRKESARKWKIVNPDKAEVSRLNRISKYREAPPNSAEVRDYMLKLRYGITQVDYNNILEKQDYCCAICNRNSKEMTYHLHTDHCHTTGKVRGLLCSPCNVYLGYIKDNPEVYLRGVDYLHENKNK